MPRSAARSPSRANGRTVARYATVEVEIAVAASVSPSVGPTATTNGARRALAEHDEAVAVDRRVVRLVREADVDAVVAPSARANTPLELVGMPGTWIVQPGSADRTATSSGA